MPLLYVLWTVALLTIIATAISTSGLVSYRLSHNAGEVLRHEALAEAALNRRFLASWISTQRRDGLPMQQLSASPSMASSSVTIQNELGRIDLNHADSLLINVFRWAGAESDEADRLVDRIIDRRVDRRRVRMPIGGITP